MCDASLIAVGIAVLGAAVGTIQQQQQASQEKAYQEDVQKAKQAAALDAYAQLKIREHQEREAAAADIARLTAQARAASGAARLQAVESGTLGGSVEALLADFARQELTGLHSIRSNLEKTTAQLHSQQEAALKVDQPYLLLGPLDTTAGKVAAGVNVLGAGFQAYQGSKPQV
jgi:phage terminase large subunit GpA-like protein